MKEVEETGLFDSIEKGLFADIKRQKDGGKGNEGVVKKSPEYWNPVEEFLKKECTPQSREERKENLK